MIINHRTVGLWRYEYSYLYSYKYRVAWSHVMREGARWFIYSLARVEVLALEIAQARASADLVGRIVT